MLGKIEGRRKGDDRGWDDRMASLTQWTWVWVDSGSWWWTGRPGVLQFMGSQRARHDWVSELNWTLNWNILCKNMKAFKEKNFDDEMLTSHLLGARYFSQGHLSNQDSKVYNFFWRKEWYKFLTKSENIRTQERIFQSKTLFNLWMKSSSDEMQNWQLQNT